MALSDVINFGALNDWMGSLFGGGQSQPAQNAMNYNPTQSMQFDTPQFQAPQSFDLANPYAVGGGMAPTTQNASIGGTPGADAEQDFFSMGRMFGGTDVNGNKTTGWLAPTTGLATVGMGAYFGNQMMNMGEQAIAGQQEIMKQNVANQTQMINTAMEDRQKARVAADPTAQPVDEYMAENAL